MKKTKPWIFVNGEKEREKERKRVVSGKCLGDRVSTICVECRNDQAMQVFLQKMNLPDSLSFLDSCMYLTYLQENFKPVAHRSASVEVFDEEDMRIVHLPPSYWGCQGT